MNVSKRFTKWSLLALCITGFLACDKNNDKMPDPSKESTYHYAYVATTDNGIFIAPLKSLQKGTISNYSDAVTLSKGHAYMEKYGDYIYAQSGSFYGFGGEQTLYKYPIDENGKMQSQAVSQLSFSGSPNVLDVTFVSDTKAYAITNNSGGKIIIFNPTTMKETGFIDMSPYAKEDNDPDCGNGIIRDGKFFVPLSQVKSMMEVLLTPAEVAVIDVNTDKVEKIIKDERAVSLGMVGHTTPIVDDEGNIYFYTGPRTAMLNLKNQGKGYKDGLLRIKKGETDFDKNFHMSLQNIEGGELGSYGMNMIYGGHNKIYTFLFKASLVEDWSENDFIKNHCYVPYEIDIRNKTGKILDLPASNGWSANAIIKEGDKIYFGEHSPKGIGFYQYDTVSGKGEQEPNVKTPSGPYLIVRTK